MSKLINGSSIILLCTGLMAPIICVMAKKNITSCEGRAVQLHRVAAKELNPGASNDSIRDFLNREGITYTFDGFAQRFQGIIRNVVSAPGVDCAVLAYIYVDQNGRYLRSEFVANFTGL